MIAQKKNQVIAEGQSEDEKEDKKVESLSHCVRSLERERLCDYFHLVMKPLEHPMLFSKEDLRHIYYPLLMETLLSVTVGIADTMMVAQAGEASVSGVSCFNTIQNFLIALFSAFGTGGSVIVSQLLGMDNDERARFASKELLYLALGVALVVGGVFFAFREQILRLIYGTVEEDVFRAALDYSLPIILSLPFMALTSSLTAVFRAQGKTQSTFVVSTIGNIVNIIGNAVCLFAFNMGAFGVGLSTLFSRIVMAAIFLVLIHSHKLRVYIDSLLRFEFNLSMAKTIFSIALPSGAESSIFQLGKIVTISTIAACGTASTASFAFLDNMGTFANITGTATGLALMVCGGRSCGAGRFDETRWYTKYFMRTAYLSIAATSLVVMSLLPVIIKIYSYSAETSSLALLVTYENLIIQMLIWPLSFTLPQALKSAGDVTFTMITAVSSMWIFRVASARILGLNLGFGLRGVMWGMYIDWAVRSVLFILRYRSGKWTQKVIRKEKVALK